MLELDRITFDSDVMGGRACIREMRITVSLVLNLVADGMSAEEIIEAYPYLEPEDVKQSLQYAAWLAEEKANRKNQRNDAIVASHAKQESEQHRGVGFMDGYEGEFILANDLIPKARLILDSAGNRKAVELDYRTWDKLLEFLEDLEDIRELDRFHPSDEEVVSLEGVMEEIRAKSIDV